MSFTFTIAFLISNCFEEQWGISFQARSHGMAWDGKMPPKGKKMPDFCHNWEINFLQFFSFDLFLYLKRDLVKLWRSASLVFVTH